MFIVFVQHLQGWAQLIVVDANEILYSREGVTQGDPRSTFIYAVATLPLISHIGRPNVGTDIRYADDASACAPLHDLVDWFTTLLRLGPSYGYYPEPKKCVLVVNHDHLTIASELFKPFGVNIATSHRLLGTPIGCVDRVNAYIKKCVIDWVFLIKKLVLVAESQLQLAYSALTGSVQCQWTYLRRVTLDCGQFFNMLESTISGQLLPAILGSEVSFTERVMFSLSTQMEGLNVLDPTFTSCDNYTTSRRLTGPIVNALNQISSFNYDEFHSHYFEVKESITKEREANLERVFEDIFTKLTSSQQRAILRAKDEKISSWLNVIPVVKHHFDLSAQEFRDALALRYKKPLLCVPSTCDGCGDPFDLSHALICRKGGLITQ